MTTDTLIRAAMDAGVTLKLADGQLKLLVGPLLPRTTLRQ